MMPCRSYDPRDDSGPEPQYDTFNDPAAGHHEAEEIRREAAEAERRHNPYPHNPGYMIGCSACEAKCHCGPDTAECVYDGTHATSWLYA